MKSLLVLGGSGFVGSAICRYATSQGIKAISLSRSGKTKYSEDFNPQVTYVKGDACNPESYKDILQEVDAVVHSIGVLVDSKIWKMKDIYQGSYEQLCRDSALSAINLIENTDKKFVYISAERGMALLPRYISTKREVETYLQGFSVPYCIVRPGVMYAKHVYNKRFLSTIIDTVNFSDTYVRKIGLEWLSDNFIPSRSLDVNLVGKAAVLGAFRSELEGKVLDVDDIEETANKFASVYE